jgi:hypothetical protein
MLRYVIRSGTELHPRREPAGSAKEALRIFNEHMRLRHPGLIVETADGERLTFFQLKERAELERRKQDA